MNRTDLHMLAGIRLEEAEALLLASRYDGAYYLAGYAVACALKACIARQTALHDFPPKPDSVHRVYTHKLDSLLEVAGLGARLHAEEQHSRPFALNWSAVKRWNEESRYERHSEAEARELYRAIGEPTDGVLQWIQQHW